MRRLRNRQRGYTLLEALISVGLLAGLAGALGPAVFGSMRVSTAILDQAEGQESLRALDEALTQIFTNAVLMSAGDNELFLQGDENTVRVASLAGDESRARVFTLHIENGTLIGAIAPMLNGEAPKQSSELIPDGARRFSYYGRANTNAPLLWRDAWNDAAPPLLVRIELAAGEDNNSIVFDYRPAGRAYLHCRFDPVSRRCRG